MAIPAIAGLERKESDTMIGEAQQVYAKPAQTERPKVEPISQIAKRADASLAEELDLAIESVAANALRDIMIRKGRRADNFGPEDMRIKRVIAMALSRIPDDIPAQMEADMRSVSPPEQTRDERVAAGIEALNAAGVRPEAPE